MSKSKVNLKGLPYSCSYATPGASRLRAIWSKKQANSISYFNRYAHPLCPNHYAANPLDKPYYNEYLWKSCKKRRCSALRSKNRVDVEADSIGVAVGMVCSESQIAGPRSLKDSQHDEINSCNFATYLKAFALVYVLPEVEWTADKIDMLLQEGVDLLEASSEGSEATAERKEDCMNPPLLRPQIYTDAENRIKRNFSLEGHTFTLALESRYLGDPNQPMETQLPHTIENLRGVLQTFFRTSHYCLLLTKMGHLLIWKRRNVFFVLDVQGRRKNDLVSDKAKGVAMLVCLHTIDNVYYLVSQLSGISPEDEFTLRELVVVRLVTPDGTLYLRDTVQRDMEFEVINSNYAYLKGNLHLSLNTADPLRSRSSIMVAVGAIMASKIDHPATWNHTMFDRLICYGVELCRSCWGDRLEEQRPINLDEFPTQLRLGQFVVELELLPNVRAGNWRSVLRVAGTEFDHHVRETLKEFGNAIFQINSQMYAVWTKGDFYYLLDAYRHTIADTAVEKDKGAWSTVRMFRDPLTMISVFHQLLKESNRPSPYHLHAVRIKNLAECPKGYALAPLPDDDDTEVQSINETILFNQLATSSGHVLAALSDYEEDLCSHTEDNSDIENFELLDNIDDDEPDLDCAEECEDEGSEGDEDTQVRDVGHKKKPKKDQNELKISKSVSFIAVPKSQQKGGDRENSRLVSGQTPTFSAPKAKPASDAKDQRLSSGESPHFLAPKEKPCSCQTDVRSAPPERTEHHSELPAVQSVTASGRPQSSSKLTSTKRDIMKPSAGPSKDLASSLEEIRATRKGIVKNSEFDSELYGKMSCPNQPLKVARFQAKTFKQKTCQQSCWCIGGKGKSQEPPEVNSKQALQATRFPGFCREAHMLAVAGSESGTVESLKRLLISSFQAANRVLTMTPWGNYVVFRVHTSSESGSRFYVFDGCTCNIDRFRHLDLSRGTAGLLPFGKLSQVVCHMIDSREVKALDALSTRLEAPCRRFEHLLARNA
ncbi:uncharacterized protein LOC108151444 [Drosophila miranda]|uniref:uncharacterized protein LOC108151444 n=1 Tax=Drosophila miranda TaxID=7229 RepID=UPI0007E6776D|nr:uncharacterized protein LOC108151444 [Drosophila miranda]